MTPPSTTCREQLGECAKFELTARFVASAAAYQPLLMALAEHESKFQPRHPPHPAAPRAHVHWPVLLLHCRPLVVLHAVQLPLVPQLALVLGQVQFPDEQIAPFVQAVQDGPQLLLVFGQVQVLETQVFPPEHT
jgi:hypothetical protein